MTLTETAFYTRAAIKYGTLLIIFLILGRIFWVIGSGVYMKIFPPPPPPPTVAFGKLPALPFPDKPGLPSFTYTLQTPTGELPQTPTTVAVYFMPQRPVSFLGLDEATKIAQSLGFRKNGYALTETIYRFEKDSSSSVLDINIINKTLSLSYNLEKTPDLLTIRPKSNSEAETATRYFLSTAGLLTGDLDSGERIYQYFKAQAPDLVEVNSLSDANFVRINYFRNKYGDLPVLTSNKSRANVWFLVSGNGDQDKHIVAGEYHYFPVDSGKTSTYPVKTAKTAWDELVAGHAFISQTPQNSNTNIVIRRVYLAYYDSGLPQGFLQPIFVFEGDGGFSAYVPAVSAQYYSGELPQDAKTATPSASPAK